MFLFQGLAAAADRYTPGKSDGRSAAEPPKQPGGVMIAKLRVLSALCALVAAVIVV